MIAKNRQLRVDPGSGSRFNEHARALEHQPDLDAHVRDSDQGEEDCDTAVKTQFINVGGGDRTEPAEDGCDQPVERRDKQPQPLVPDTAEAAFKRRRCDRDRLVRRGAGAEGVHDHHAFAEPTRHKKVVQPRNLAPHPYT